MIDWLTVFMENVVERPEDSCSCCSDCDMERLAAYKEILRLRGQQPTVVTYPHPSGHKDVRDV